VVGKKWQGEKVSQCI